MIFEAASFVALSFALSLKAVAISNALGTSPFFLYFKLKYVILDYTLSDYC